MDGIWWWSPFLRVLGKKKKYAKKNQTKRELNHEMKLVMIYLGKIKDELEDKPYESNHGSRLNA